MKTKSKPEVFNLPKLKREVAAENQSKARGCDALKDALKSAHELLAKCGGTALGIAMSGKDHPNPDEKLEELFQLCNAEGLKIGKLLNGG